MGIRYDLTGQKFNRLTVIERAEDKIRPNGSRLTMWKCRCDCGNEIIAQSTNLKSGNTKSCGCYQKDRVRETSFEDLTGKRFGKLQVIEIAPKRISKSGQQKTMWNCLCDCGNMSVVNSYDLKSGHIKSCGCIIAENNHERLFEDLTGQKYNRLYVMYQMPTIKKKTMWHCLCDCGIEVNVSSSEIKSGKTKSCGCYRKDISHSRAEDLTGKKFNRLTVLYRVKERKGTIWRCLCDCGNEVEVSASHLKNGHTNSCGCYMLERIHETNFESLIGQKFGKLFVQYQTDDYVSPSGNKTTRWHCKCDCGNEVDVNSYCLKNGQTKSCGCIKKEIGQLNAEDLTGKVFGKLTVIHRSDDYITPQGLNYSRWHCKCECGNEIDVNMGNLKRGHSLSCGCLNMSRLEFLVNKYLQDNNYSILIDYKPQVRFEDLRGVGRKPLSYDFGIYKEDKLIKLIECQGVQHYVPIEHFGGDNQLLIQKEHDRAKREYANYIGVALIEVPYTLKSYIDISEYLFDCGI